MKIRKEIARLFVLQGAKNGELNINFVLQLNVCTLWVSILGQDKRDDYLLNNTIEYVLLGFSWKKTPCVLPYFGHLSDVIVLSCLFECLNVVQLFIGPQGISKA